MSYRVPRVLHVIGAMNVGGAETMLMNLYRHIDRSRVQFDFAVYDEEAGVFDDEIETMGGRVLRLPRPRERGILAAVGDMRTLIRREGPFHAVHAHVLHASALAMRAAEAEGVAIRIAHSHNTDDVPGGLVRHLYERWSRHVIHTKATKFVACGTEAGHYLFGNRRWTLLRNGVNLERFRPPDPATRMAARREFDLPVNCLALGIVARLEPVKNHDFVIRLARALADQGSEFRVLLAGDGSRRAELKELVRQQGLENHVAFLGLWGDVPRLLAALDGLLMPSHYEGIPVALVEAQATGLPCLVSEAVSREVDLGVGLVDFLPLEGTDAWLQCLSVLRERRAPADDVLPTRLRNAGADIAQGVALLNRIYGMDPVA